MVAIGIRTINMISENLFATREEASIAAATYIAEILKESLIDKPELTMAVSGGTSPERCFLELSECPLDWQRVRIILSDERWVTADHPDSNERLVRKKLLRSHAAKAKLLSVYKPQVTIEQRCEALQQRLQPLLPFCCSLLGMGEDGHFASLFPDSPNLEAALELDNKTLCTPIKTAASMHPRWSLTLSALTQSDNVILLFFGQAKRNIYTQAKDSISSHPISRLLLQDRVAIQMFWAP